MNGTRTVSLLLVATLVGCTGGSGGPYQPPSGAPTPNAPLGWPVRTAEYVDVWMHGFALLTPDTARVPLFERGYRDRMLAIRRQRNVTTALDANQATLAAGFTRNPGLVGGQFAIFAFASFDEMVRVTQLFVRNDGSPSTVNDQTTQQLFVWLRNYFPTVADREWLRLFVQSLEDEQTKFYNSYWTAQQGDRAAARQQVSALWTGTYRAKFERFMRNIRPGGARMIDGTVILSLPIGGEGRTVTDQTLGNGIAVPFPSIPDSAINAIYVLAHELVADLTQHALEDNTTPADKRAGAVDKMLPIATVRAGAILLAKVAPEAVAGYQRYYLQHIGMAAPAGDPSSAFASAFSI
ncbi:MAG TPA: hypothetical protein VIV65_08265, partial [Gemmatimonadaceae bacterium]